MPTRVSPWVCLGYFLLIAQSSLSAEVTEENISGVDSDPFPIPGNGRLPSSLYPINYEIKLDVFLGNASYNGFVSILFETKNKTDKIILNMVDLVTVNETCKITSPDTKEEIPVSAQKYATDLQFYIIYLNETLVEGKTFVLSVGFRGTLNNKLVGFYLSSYKNAQGEDVRVASTQFSPTDARRAFPCFDEPGFKATFDISIERDENLTALSNMPISTSVPVSGKIKRIVDHFHRTLRMSTYIVGFMVSDFEYRSSNALKGIDFRLWSHHDVLNQTSYALEVGPKLLTYLEEYFGVKYPLPKLDMVAIPDFKFRGMENWGLIMFRESAILFDPVASSTGGKRAILTVLAHEIAHMWFGNLVTPNWWSDLWLKEGFATFMGYKAIEAVEPSWNIMDYMLQSEIYSASTLDSLLSSHPINVEVDHADRISEIFDDISYSKGASIIRMMQSFLTEPVYKRGMQAYIKNLQYKNAEQSDLWHYLTESWKLDKSFEADRTVEQIMNTWTLQDGFPVVSLQRNGSHIFLEQERFVFVANDNLTMDLNGTESDAECINRTWWIPISFAQQSNATFDETEPKIWMSPTEEITVTEDLAEENEWLILNVQRTGFYRVNYDNTTWNLLLEQMKTYHNIIHLLNRGQLVDDSFNLAKAGLLDYEVPLRLGKYMKREKDLTVWTMFFNNLKYIYNMIKSTKQVDLLNKYVIDIIVPIYDETGFEDKPEESYSVKSLRSLIIRWACRVGYEPCLAETRKLFDTWIQLPTNKRENVIPSNVKWTVLCNGIKHSSEENWNKTFDAYLTSNVPTEKYDILSALGCTEDLEILTRYINMSLEMESGIIKQDSSSVFSAVSYTITGRDLAWNIIKLKWREILEFFGSGSNALWTVIEVPTKTFNTHELVNELEEFKKTYEGHLGSARQSVKKALEKAKLNAHWMGNFFPLVLQWLETNENAMSVNNPATVA